MNIILCCFASRRYWAEGQELEEAFQAIKKEMGNLYTEAVLIDERFDIERLNKSKIQLMLAIPMSGAVQPQMLKGAEYFKSVLVYAGYVKGNFNNSICEKMLIHNAAPAAMDVYAVLKRTKTTVRFCIDKIELTRQMRVVDTYIKLRNSKLLAVGATEPWVISSVKNWNFITDRFGIQVLNIAQQELIDLYHHITEKEVEAACKLWSNHAGSIIEPSKTDVCNAVRLQTALTMLMREYEAAGAALACFDMLKTGTTSCLGVSYINTYTDYTVACEGDMDSAVTMMIMKQLAQDSVWMANPNIQPDQTVNFVHCTAPIIVGSQPCSYILRNHHESGIGVSPQVELPKNRTMTACRISENMSKLTVQTCIGISGNYESSCRTQLKIKFENFEKYIKDALGCHQVFAFSDIKEELLSFADLTGMEVL